MDVEFRITVISIRVTVGRSWSLDIVETVADLIDAQFHSYNALESNLIPMNTFSTDDMTELNRLTGSGDPADATTLIRSVLSRTGAFDAISGAPHSRETGALRGRRFSDATTSSAARSTQSPGANERSDVGPGGAFLDGLYPGVESPLHYKLFRPSVDNTEPAPLLVMLHGCTQDAQDFATGTAMNAVAQAAGLYVLYPTQGASANINRCWNWFEPAHQSRDRGEPALLSGLTRQIIRDYPINADQVFIAGLSAGGAMALIMAEEYPELFAAVGVHSGLPTGVASSMSDALSAMQTPASHGSDSSGLRGEAGGWSPRLPFRHFSPITGQPAGKVRRHGSPIPTIVFHGDRDPTVNCANADRIVADWLARNSEIPDQGGRVPDTDSIRMPCGFGYTVTRYDRGDDSRQVGCEQWTLECSGHRWSGGNSAGSFTDAQGPDASAEMVRFFLSAQPR